MTVSQQIKTGLSAYGKAFHFIFKNKMGWTLIVPFVLSILIFAIAQSYINELSDYLKNLSTNWDFIQNSAFWGDVFKGLISFITEIVFLIAFAYFGGYIVLIIMSPFLSYLSEKTEQIISGKEYKFKFKQLITDTFRGIFMALRNLFIETLIIIPAFFLSFIPFVGLLATAFMFLISAYFYGFSFIDYINERQRLSVKESAKMVRNYKWIAIANGSIFALPLIIPLIGSQISIFVSIFSVVAATIAILEAKNSKLNG